MFPFLHIVKLSARQQLTYRAATLSGLATNIVFGLLRVALVLALYAGQPSVNGMTTAHMVTFIAISQALIAFMFTFGNFELIQTVIDGSITNDLTRPIPHILFWMARDLGRGLVNLVLRGLSLLLIFALFYPLTFTNGWWNWVGSLLSLTMAWLLNFFWRHLVNLLSFWVSDARGLARSAFALSMLFCGFVFPLRLFPEWFSALARLTPFPYMYNLPVEALLGLQSGPQLGLPLLTQALWTVALAGLCLAANRAGIRRLALQGG